MIRSGGRGMLSGFGAVQAVSVVASGSVTALQHVATQDSLGFVFSADTDTGLTRLGSDSLSLETGGASRMSASNGDVTIAGANDLRFTGSFAGNGDSTPAQITSDQDNYSIASTVYVARLSTDASRNITGITSGFFNRTLILMNVGSFDIVLVHDATSTAANRFLNTTGANVTMAAGRIAICTYDDVVSRWRAFVV